MKHIFYVRLFGNKFGAYWITWCLNTYLGSSVISLMYKHYKIRVQKVLLRLRWKSWKSDPPSSHCLAVKTKDQKGMVTCPGSHRWLVAQAALSVQVLWAFSGCSLSYLLPATSRRGPSMGLIFQSDIDRNFPSHLCLLGPVQFSSSTST